MSKELTIDNGTGKAIEPVGAYLSIDLANISGRLEPLRDRLGQLRNQEPLACHALAKQGRMEVRSVRLAAIAWHKAEKEDSLRKSQILDKALRVFLEEIEPIEAGYLEIETYEARALEAKRLQNEKEAQLRRDGRLSMLAGLSYPPGCDLGNMSEDEFQAMLKDAQELKALRDQKAKEAREAEAAALEKDRQDRVEQARLNAELMAERKKMEAKDRKSVV